MQGNLIGFIYLGKTPNREPICNYEGSVGGDGYVIVQGWAYDPDDPNASIGVHVYIGGPAGAGERHVIAADQYREDVNRTHGIGGNHGFRAVIPTDRRGLQVGVFPYAIDTSGGNNPPMGELKVDVYEPRGAAVTSLAEGRYAVRSALDGIYGLDVQDGSRDDRAPLVLWKWNGGDHQRFDVSLNDDGSYTLLAAHSGKAVEVFGASVDEGAAVSQYAANGTNAQRWWLERNDDGTWSLRNRVSGRYVDDSGAAVTPGNPIIQYTGNGTAAQRWYLVPVDASAWEVSVPQGGTDPAPAPTVVAGGVELEEGRDYTVTHRLDAGSGKGTLTVTAINGFTGSKTVSFYIASFDHDGWVTLPSGGKGYAKGGRLVRGWMDIGPSKHWFDEDGAMATGWTDVEVSGKVMHYYFNPASGNLVRGTWFDIGGEKYYFRPSGNLATGWATIDDAGVDKKYYFEEDGTLVRDTWYDVDNDEGVTNHHYFRPSGAMATGWATIGGEKYFFRPSGNMATGFADVPEDAFKRYFDASGRMVTGWQSIGGNRYYFRASGAMQTGTATIDGKACTFSDKGVLIS